MSDLVADPAQPTVWVEDPITPYVEGIWLAALSLAVAWVGLLWLAANPR